MAAGDPTGAPGVNSPGARIQVERIYLKDLSFEAPQAPDVFRGEWKPDVQLDINTRANRLDGSRFEVVLTATLSARLDAVGGGEPRTGLIVEVQQAGVFLVEGVEGAPLQQILAMACPDILFPYVRETVDNIVVKGTFPPFMLAPVDFAALYREALRRHETMAGEKEN